MINIVNRFFYILFPSLQNINLLQLRNAFLSCKEYDLT